MKERKARKIMNRLEDPRRDPLPEEARTGPWFKFAHDGKEFLNPVDPANVPRPYDKVILLPAWLIYQKTMAAINEERKKFNELPPAEKIAAMLSNSRKCQKDLKVYLAWHRFWQVRYPNAKWRKWFAETVSAAESAIENGERNINHPDAQ
jgi:hypothetical protein